MRVFKFGGASIADAGRMAALLPIISEEQQPLLLVLSALGKTTNALERIVNLACKSKKDEAVALAKQLEQQHLDQAKALLDEVHFVIAATELNKQFEELERAIQNADGTRYDYSYDQIVCMGELFSSRMFSIFLQQNELPAEWIDIRKVMRTDDTYRDAVVDWDFTKLDAEALIGRRLQHGKIIVTQGFIGSTAEG